ncbi:MAG: nucleotide disphospho-sugar-binding domain-containing protein, partial [Ilumatobacteraceae bacterium]
LAHRLSRLLVDAGHRVVMIETLDVPSEPVDLADPRVERRNVSLRPPADGVRHRWRPVAQWGAVRAAADAIEPARLGVVLDDVAADLAIIDVEEYEALISALALPHHPQLTVLCSFFEPWPISGTGPNDGGPPSGSLDRVRGRVEWWALWARMRLYGVKQHFVGVGVDRIAVSRALARRLGVRSQLTTRQWVHPFIPADLPLLLCNAEELDVPHEPRNGVHHIGSLLDPARPLDELDDRALAETLAQARREGRPIVACAFGAVMAGEPSPLVDRIVDAAELRPQYEFVVATADAHRRRATAAPANLHAVPWLPQREVLAVSAAAIVHSGNATLHECVAAEVPMIVYPFAVNDQPRNAARIVRHGIGEVGDREHDDATTIATRLDRVMADTEMRKRIEELAEPITRYEREGVAVAVVESLLPASDCHVSDDRRTPR